MGGGGGGWRGLWGVQQCGGLAVVCRSTYSSSGDAVDVTICNNLLYLKAYNLPIIVLAIAMLSFSVGRA